MCKYTYEPPNEFLKFSQELGQNILHIQGAGGNTSVKTSSGIWVKASGFRLDECLEKNCFIHLPMNNESAPDQTSSLDRRSSIETSFHIGLKKKYVVHTHFLNAIAYTVSENLKETLEKKLNGLNWSYVSYAMPGEVLWNEIKQSMGFCDPNIFILEHHGVIFTGNNLEQIREDIRDLELRLELPKITIPIFKDCAGVKSEQYPNYSWTEDTDLKSIAFDNNLSNLFFQKVLYPDQVVFFRDSVSICEPENLHNFLFSQPTALCVLVIGRGVLIHDSLSDPIKEMLRAHAKLILLLGNGDKISSLNSKHCLDLLNWDAEKYRKGLNGG
jgi:rhamnose utilization protein RhaD (predicted bifunctional aldolase and dehydrogenase)